MSEAKRNRSGSLATTVTVTTAVAIATLFAAFAAAQELRPVGPLLGPVGVIEVIDGDTIVLASNLGPRIVRLIGIDSPEVHHPEKGREPFGPEASTFLKELLPIGSQVVVELDLETNDVYGRLLAYVYLRDAAGSWTVDGEPALMVNLAVAEVGFARTLPIPPNLLYADLFDAAVREARSSGRGMWATPAETEPEANAAAVTAVPDGQIVIACILYDPATPNDENGEIVFLEVREPLDTRGYYLHDQGSGTILRLPAGVQEVGVVEVLNPGQGIWNNGGDTVFLKLGDAVIDEWTYPDRAAQGEMLCR